MKLLRLIFVLLTTVTLATACGVSGDSEDGTDDDDGGFSRKPQISKGQTLFDQASRIEPAERDVIDGLWLENGTMRREGDYRYRIVMQLDSEGDYMVMAKHCQRGSENAYAMLRFSAKFRSDRIRNSKDRQYIGRSNNTERNPLLCTLTLPKGNIYFEQHDLSLDISNSKSMSNSTNFIKTSDL